MATRTQVQLIDDLDGESVATETIKFALDGTDYEIDLSDYHAKALRENLADYIEHARKVTGAKPASVRRPRHAKGGAEVKQIREWAREHGHQVSDRGRIPTNVVQAYQQAQ